MGLELVTGYWGMDHVTEEQEADKHAGTHGTGRYVLPLGLKMKAEAVTSNQVRIFDGTGFAYGRQFHIEEGAYENVTIENGAAGMLRNDFIVLKYKKDEATGVEGITFEVLKGQSGETAVDPVPNNVDIRTGVFESEIPLYRIRLNGLAIEAVEALFYVPNTIEELSKKCAELEQATDALNSKIANKVYSVWYDTTSHSFKMLSGMALIITSDAKEYIVMKTSSNYIIANIGGESDLYVITGDLSNNTVTITRSDGNSIACGIIIF